MDIDDLPIPQKVADLIKEEGIKKLYPPQVEAVKKGLFEDNNLVIAIPTASGKTLLALLACVHNIEKKGMKALYLAPLRALAYEKYVEFKRIFDSLGKKTVILTGDYDKEDQKAKYADVIIATNEKIDSELRHGAKWVRQLGIIIVDEVHLINNRNRGPTLEVVIAQLRQITETQIIALSATIKNADQIARWLEAELVSSDWRSVKLNEGVVYGNNIIYADGSEKTIPMRYKDSFDNLLNYILTNNHQAIVFGTTRNMTESIAKKIARRVSSTLKEGERLKLNEIANELIKKGEQTKQSKEVASLIRQGTVFHHAGLNLGQRRFIEESFKRGYIKIITSTPTLASGVNLPARYVVIKSIYRYDVTLGSYPIPVLEFKQQSGRAGRPQFDKEGDAILIAKSEIEAQKLFQRYLIGETEEIESRIAAEPALRRIVLGQIATENVQSLEELNDFFSQTFYGYQQDTYNLASILIKVIDYLKEEGLIIKDPDYLDATSFGKRASQLYIDPLSAVIIRDGLNRSKIMAKEFLTDLSLLHLVCSTPDVRFISIKKSDEIPILNIMSKHDEEFLTELPSSPFELELFMSQLKTAFIIQDWITETSEDSILDRYNVGSGDVFSVVSNAEWLLYATNEIAKLLGYSEVAAKTKILHNRVINGIKEELLDLVSIPGIGRVRARLLFNKGYSSQEIIKQTNPTEMQKIPGIGTEIVKSIYNHLFGEKKSLEMLQELPSEESEENSGEYSQSQKSLEDFFTK